MIGLSYLSICSGVEAAKGAHIPRARCATPTRLCMGEGIETTLAVRTALSLPDSVDEAILLGDGDSDPTTTTWALERGCARHARRACGRPRRVRAPMAAAGGDFNDMLGES